jgi:hypothetical protein
MRIAAFGGSGVPFGQVIPLRSFPRQPLPTFFPPCKCYAFAYPGRQNRRQQPEHYVQYSLKIC